MYKRILPLIAIMLLFALAFAACETAHVHDWTMKSNASEHWQVCFDDGTEKEQSRQPHSDQDNDGRCDGCGYVMPKSGDSTDPTDPIDPTDPTTPTDPKDPTDKFVPDERNFWIVGNFEPSNWNESYRDELKFTRQSEPDANGNTVYTFEFVFAEGNKFKIVNDAGSSYYDGELNANNLTTNAQQYFQSEGVHNNIQLKGAPGLYRITVRVNGAFAEVDAEPLF